MAVRLYDNALVKKIQGWIYAPDLKVLGPDETAELFSMTLDENYDAPIQLPLISISRETDVTIQRTNKNALSVDGLTFEAMGEIDPAFMRDIKLHPDKHPHWSVVNGMKGPGYAYKLNAVPITIRYQLDIYTRYSDEGDEYMRNFVFNFINDPKLKIDLPYNNLHLEHISNVFIDQRVSDNSDIPQRIFKDQFTRWTIGLEINDAYLFSIPKYDNLELEIDGLQLQDSDGQIASENL